MNGKSATSSCALVFLSVLGCGSTSGPPSTTDAPPAGQDATASPDAAVTAPDTAAASADGMTAPDAATSPPDAFPSTPNDAAASVDTAKSTADSAASAPDAARFGAGIYYRNPRLDNPAATLARVGSPLAPAITMSPVGFDLVADKVVFPYPGGLVVVSPTGDRRLVPIPGLFGVSRPSFSPDGKRVAVQASTSSASPPPDLDIFVVSLDDASFRRVGDLPWNEESPRFFPRSNKLAYSSFSPTDGVNLHVFDLDANKETLVVKDGGALQIAVSPDEKRIAEFWRLRLLDSTTGAVVAELRAPLEAALAAAGWTPDTANPGRGGRMTFVLDGSFSPDGLSLVIDGAVAAAGKTGSALFSTPLASVALTALTGLVELGYDFSNGNNFSQLNPLWR